MNDAEKCRTNEWGVGTQLVGNEGYGDTVIEITAIGEKYILAKAISHDGESDSCPDEHPWTLECRDWRAKE